jgi:hypothetical protein
VAAATVAGVVAMLLQVDPASTPQQVLAALQQSAAADAKTGAVPNALWGAGKLRVPEAAPTAVDQAALARLAFAPAYPNPSRGEASFEFSLAPEDLPGDPVQMGVRVLDVRGRQVAWLSGFRTEGRQRLTWNGRLVSGDPAPAGVYFGQLEVGESRVVRKFVRLP